MTEAIHAKMAAILKDMDAIGKNSTNEQQKFKYRGIDDVYNAINPVMAKHGVYMTAKILEKSREERPSKSGGILMFTCLRMCYSFWAEDGSHVETEAEGEGMDSGDKSSNKAMAVAHKYALLQAFCIPTKDLDDPDAQSHELGTNKITDDQRQTLLDMLERSSSDVEKFCAYFKINAIPDLLAKDYPRAVEALNMKERKKA